MKPGCWRVNRIIISCLVSTGHPKGRKWEMKSFGFSSETVLLRFEFVGSPNEVTPSEKRGWLTQDLINTTSAQFGSVIISLSVLCKALPQARCEREGDRSRWGRPKWTTHRRHEFWPQKLGRSSWSFGWGVSQRSSNGRMVIILGGGNPSTKAWWQKLCSVVGKAGWMAGPLGWRHITKILKYLEIHGWTELSPQFHIDDWSPGQPDPGQGTLSHACYVGTGGSSWKSMLSHSLPPPSVCQDHFHRPPGKPRTNTVISFIWRSGSFFFYIKNFINISTSDPRWSFQGIFLLYEWFLRYIQWNPKIPLETPHEGFPGMQKEIHQHGEEIGANTHPISKRADLHWSILYISPLHRTSFGKKKKRGVIPYHEKKQSNKILS